MAAVAAYILLQEKDADVIGHGVPFESRRDVSHSPLQDVTRNNQCGFFWGKIKYHIKFVSDNHDFRSGRHAYTWPI
jgi:hypothetical protein